MGPFWYCKTFFDFMIGHCCYDNILSLRLTLGDTDNFTKDLREAFEFADYCISEGTLKGFQHKKEEIKTGTNKNIFSFSQEGT